MAEYTRKEQIIKGSKITPLTRTEVVLAGGVVKPLTQKERTLNALIMSQDTGGGPNND